MKLLPVLPPVCAGPSVPNQQSNMDRIPVPLTFNPDLLWRYPISLPSSPLLDFKTHLPNNLATDPRIWTRDDVVAFLHWCEREFDLQPFDMEMFQMNGKAICLLTRNDLSERSPGAGDVLHNVLQLLVRDASLLRLPSSPVTPTSRHTPYPLSPHSHPPTPNWNVLSQTDHFQTAAHAASLAHFINQGNSVTLSPAPSIDSQSSSPQHADCGGQQQMPIIVPKTEWPYNHGGNGGSGHSDSDSDSYQAHSPQNGHQNESPPNTPNNILAMPPIRSPKKEMMGQSFYRPAAREFFPSDPTPTEPSSTSGRLLWDFLQQLLNDPAQRYTNHIAWKNRDTGVFKIVDPAGLAKLWGIQKNHLSMNYDKMSRALRYYYRVNILRKVQGERHCYQFLRNPSELKNIKNISLLRQQMSPTQTTNQQTPSTIQQQQTQIFLKNENDLRNLKNQTQNAHFLKSENELRNLKNLSIMRPAPSSISQQPPNTIPQSLSALHSEIAIKMEESNLQYSQHHLPSESTKQRHQSSAHDDDEEMPTDLSMVQSNPTDLSSKSDKHRISVLCASEINQAENNK